MERKTIFHLDTIRAASIACALLLPTALLVGVAAAQTPDPPEITVYHSLDGSDPRPEYPPGCTAPVAPGGGGGVDSGFDSGFDSGGGTPGSGGWVVVVGDVNAGNNPTFYTNLLEGDTQVLAGRGDTPTNSVVIDHYQSLPGVTTTVSDTTITSAALAGVDLLIFNQPDWDLALVFTPDELIAIRDFVIAGGNLLLFAETFNHEANFTEFLSGIGSSISYTTLPRSFGGSDVLAGAPFTTGVAEPFDQLVFNQLSLGDFGQAIVTNDVTPFQPYVAAQRLGTDEPSLPECVLGGDSYEELSLWIAGKGSDSTDPTKTCILDEADADGGEICGAKLRFQLSGIGRFRKFIPDSDDMDTLVLGEPCLPEEGLGCIFETDPPVTSLEMDFVRGGMPLSAAPRRLGSLIVDSTGLVKGTNSTLINVFGSAADAQLHLVKFGTLPPHIIVVDSDLIPMPEPGQLLQLVSGLFGLAGLQRLRRRH